MQSRSGIVGVAHWHDNNISSILRQAAPVKPASNGIISADMIEPLLRQAAPQDSGRLAELLTQLGYPASADEIRTRLASVLSDEDHAVFVAELDGRVAGWVHVFIYKLLEADRHGGVGGLVVDETQRGRGIGRKLMECAEGWASQQGCPVLDLRSNILREQAHEFYRAIGYERYKTQYAFRKPLK